MTLLYYYLFLFFFVEKKDWLWWDIDYKRRVEFSTGYQILQSVIYEKAQYNARADSKISTFHVTNEASGPSRFRQKEAEEEKKLPNHARIIIFPNNLS